MHPVHNCHHIKSCHPPDKQYIKTHHNTEFIIYTCSLFLICNTKVSMRCGMVCEYLLYSGQCPPQDTSLEVSLPRSTPSPRFLPPAVHASSRPFLARSLHQPSLPPSTLPSSTDALSLPSIIDIASSLP